MGIEIPNAARMSQLMTRSPYKPYLTAEWQAKMHKKMCIRDRCYLRIFSRNIYARQLENQRFMQFWWKLKTGRSKRPRREQDRLCDSHELGCGFHICV